MEEYNFALMLWRKTSKTSQKVNNSVLKFLRPLDSSYRTGELVNLTPYNGSPQNILRTTGKDSAKTYRETILLHGKTVGQNTCKETLTELHRTIAVGRHPWRSSGPTPLLKQGHLQLVAQDRVQRACEYLQGWRLQNPLGILCRCLVTLTVKKCFLMFPDRTSGVSVCTCCLFSCY